MRCVLYAISQASSVRSDSAVGTPSLRAPSGGGPSLRINSSSLSFDMRSVASGSLGCGRSPVSGPLQAVWLGSAVSVPLQALFPGSPVAVPLQALFPGCPVSVPLQLGFPGSSTVYLRDQVAFLLLLISMYSWRY